MSWRIGRRFRIEGDIRAGKRKVRDDMQTQALDLQVDTRERYRRARLNAVFQF